MATTEIKIIQKIETILKIEYDDLKDLEKQIAWTESLAETRIHKGAAIKHSEVFIAADTPRS